jgi:hypothetical protein
MGLQVQVSENFDFVHSRTLTYMDSLHIKNFVKLASVF